MMCIACMLRERVVALVVGTDYLFIIIKVEKQDPLPSLFVHPHEYTTRLQNKLNSVRTFFKTKQLLIIPEYPTAQNKKKSRIPKGFF
jgi:hypothetical protein